MSNAFGEDFDRPTLKTSWDIAKELGRPPAKISVRNLEAIIQVGKDAWGRERKVQPVLISATVSLRRPFGFASMQDTVNDSTIHYGSLSKVILEAAQDFHDQGGVSTKNGKQSSVKALMDHIKANLHTRSLSGSTYHTNRPSLSVPASIASTLLDRALVSLLELEIRLPKALLNSMTGVSRLSTTFFGHIGEALDHRECWGMSLVLRNLQISTLIGVNLNERLAKQLVIANVEIDVWITEQDVYNELEEIVVKVSQTLWLHFCCVAKKDP